MAPKTRKSSARIKSGTPLAKAVELIASDQLRDTTRKPVRTYYRINTGAARILLRITAKDSALGWRVLLGCDAMSFYGEQIPMAYKGFCAEKEETFTLFTANRDEAIVRWVDREREGDG